MSSLTRFVFTLPVTIPLLWMAAGLDFFLFSMRGQLKSDPPDEIAKAAWKVMGV